VIGIGPALGDGPFWGSQTDSKNCKQSWWEEMAYVQNIMTLIHSETHDGVGTCLGHLWYLSNDMQFFVAAPLLVYPYIISARLGWIILTLAVLASTAANVAISIHGNYTASPLFDMAYFAHVYVQPYTRAQPYLIGIALAYGWDDWTRRATAKSRGASKRAAEHPPVGHQQLHQTVGSVQNDASGAQPEPPHGTPPQPEPPHERHDDRLSPSLVWSLIVACAAVMLLNMFGTYGLYQNYPTHWGVGQNVSYIALSRLGWAIALSGISFLCFIGEMPLLNAFLSCATFELMGKLTYAAYIVHPLIISPISFGSDELVKFSDGWFAASFTTYLVWACAVALTLWLLVEKPCANLIAIALAQLTGANGGGGEA